MYTERGKRRGRVCFIFSRRGRQGARNSTSSDMWRHTSFSASLARMARGKACAVGSVVLRVALVALLTLVYVESRGQTSTTDVESRRRASSAAPSYRAKTFPLRVPNLRNVLRSAPTKDVEGRGEDDGGGATPQVAQTMVNVGEFAGYTWYVVIIVIVTSLGLVASPASLLPRLTFRLPAL